MLEGAISVLELFNRNSAVVALFSALITSIAAHLLSERREARSRKTEKALEIYDRSLSLLSEFRCNPSLALTDDYLLSLMGVSVSLRAYGDKSICKSMELSFNSIQRYRNEYKSKLKEVDDEYVDWAEDRDWETGEVTKIPIPLVPDEIIRMKKKEVRSDSIPSYEDAKQIVDQFADAISQTLGA